MEQLDLFRQEVKEWLKENCPASMQSGADPKTPIDEVWGGKKFIEVGDKVKKGQTVMIVEAMKTMNHIPSTNDGVVKEVLVKDGQPVEFGQSLVLLK